MDFLKKKGIQEGNQHFLGGVIKAFEISALKGIELNKAFYETMRMLEMNEFISRPSMINLLNGFVTSMIFLATG